MQMNNFNFSTDNSDHHLYELIVHEETETDTALIEHATKASKNDCQNNIQPQQQTKYDGN